MVCGVVKETIAAQTPQRSSLGIVGTGKEGRNTAATDPEQTVFEEVGLTCEDASVFVFFAYLVEIGFGAGHHTRSLMFKHVGRTEP